MLYNDSCGRPPFPQFAQYSGQPNSRNSTPRYSSSQHSRVLVRGHPVSDFPTLYVDLRETACMRRERALRYLEPGLRSQPHGFALRCHQRPRCMYVSVYTHPVSVHRFPLDSAPIIAGAARWRRTAYKQHPVQSPQNDAGSTPVCTPTYAY